MKKIDIKKIISISAILLLVLPVFAYADKGGDDDKNDDRNNKNENRGRGYLKDKDKEKVDKYINKLSQRNGVNVLHVIINRINSLIASTKSSNMNPVVKERRLLLLEELKELLVIKLDEFGFTDGGINDNTAPTLTSLMTTATSNTQVSFSISSSEVGRGFYVVLPSGSITPTSSQVRDGKNSSGVTVALRGEVNLSSGTNGFSVAGLTATTSYIIFFTARDTAGNLSAAVNSLSFTTSNTSADVLAPIFTTSLTGITNTGVSLNITINEAGKGYYVVLPNGSLTPTPAQVKAGTDSIGTSASIKGNMNLVSGANISNVTGLSANTNYIIFFTAEDAVLNLSTSVSSTSLTTTNVAIDTMPPVFSLVLTGVTSIGATLDITMNEAGKGYYVVLPNGSLTPTPAQVKAGNTWGGTTAAIKGNMSLVSGSNISNMTGLSANTNYIIFFTAEDLNGNLLLTTQSIGFSTPQ